MLIAAVACGAALRLVWPSDMEFKLDEAYNVEKVRGDPWTWTGQTSSIGIPNPGMGIWVLAVLGRGLGLSDPVSLAQGVMVLNVLALLGLAWFAVRVVRQEAWLWATALLAVSPIAVQFSRKIWIQSVLAPFALVVLVAWWRRGAAGFAFVWGMVGAWLGQIQMSGFFFAAGLAAWTWLFDRRGVRWRWWLAGSAIGFASAVPWLWEVLTGGGLGDSPRQVPRLTFWREWFVEYPLGFDLRTTFGSEWGAFLEFPTAGGTPLRLVLVTFVVIAATGLLLGARGVLALWPRRRALLATLRSSDSALLVTAGFVAFGLLLTFSFTVVHRHYLLVAFVLPFLTLSLLALARPGRVTRLLLGVLVAALAALSVQFLAYVHVNHGAPGGDYGVSYRAQPGR